MKKAENGKSYSSSTITKPTDTMEEDCITHHADRERNLFLAKSYIGEVIAADLREIIRDSATKVMKENEIIEELQDRIRNYEDHIQCLEQLVRELQLMLRNSLEKESSVHSGDSHGSHGSPEKVENNATKQTVVTSDALRMQSLKHWFARPIEDMKTSSVEIEGSPSPPVHTPPKKEKMMFHKTSHGTHSSAGGEGILDDFI